MSLLAQLKKPFAKPLPTSPDPQSLDSRAAELGAALKDLDVKRWEAQERARDPQEALTRHIQELDESRRAVLNLLEDLTETKAQVDAARAYDEALLASIADVVVAIDRQGIITTVNPAIGSLFGYIPAELIGRKVWDFFVLSTHTGDVSPLHEHPLYKALNAPAYATFTDDVHYARRKNNSRFPVLMDAASVMDADHVIGAVAVIRDVTAERAAESAKNEFVTLASHQLRTPLTTITWHAELLLGQEAGTLNEAQRGYADKILSAGRRLLALVDTLLDVSRIEMGILAVRSQDVDMGGLARDVVADISADVSRRNLSVRIDDQTAGQLFHGDPALLRIVLQNLLSNAVKYTPAQGSILIGLSFSGRRMMMKVADSGIGIPEAARPRIYDKLFRADNAQKLDPAGNGLGLYLVKSVVQGTGGDISFLSEEGKGTTFTVSFPEGGMKEQS